MKTTKPILVVRRDGRWVARWKFGKGLIVRYASSPEFAIIALLASEPLEPRDRRVVAAHIAFQGWLINNGLMDLRRRLLFAKRDGWDDASMPEAVRVYREWRREQTGGTSLGLGE